MTIDKNIYAESNYVLVSSFCDDCVFGEHGFYNPICVHCPSIQYGKHKITSFVARDKAKPKEENNGRN